MKTVILCGGKGTRIRDVSTAVPKPMVEVAGLPIVHHIMNYYARYGLSDFVLCLGYKGEVIYDYFSRLATASTDKTISISQNDTITQATSKTQWNIALVDTGLETMTGGRIRRISSHVSNETFTLTYGDGLSNIDIQKLIEHHRTCGKTLTVSGVRPPSRFGELTVSGNLVVGFDEKPQAASVCLTISMMLIRSCSNVSQSRRLFVTSRWPCTHTKTSGSAWTPIVTGSI
jgi:glucose-1-phosphate cytidylyltransferase